jgi:simple sugar transport system ATP-binding protein
MIAPLELFQISKKYGESFFANQNVNFQFHRGQIHALVGENGAGKTTLMKILFGLEKPTSGEIRKNGRPIQVQNPVDAKKHGIAMVYQHFMLEEQLTVHDHLQLEMNSRQKIWVWPQAHIELNQLRTHLDQLKLKIDLNTPIKSLSVVEKQKVEILKTLLFEPEFLIFDEPTAVLPPDETRSFYQLLETLKTQGRSIALITHKLADVIEFADQVTVLRHGVVKFKSTISKTNASEIAHHMIGSSESLIDESLQKPKNLQPKHDRQMPPALAVDGFSTNTLKDLTFSIPMGEIVSLAGVEGNGQQDLVNSVMQPELLARAVVGSLSLLGKPLIKDSQVTASSQDVRQWNLGYIGPDRLTDSAIMEFDLQDHFRLLPKYRNAFFLKSILKNQLCAIQNDFDIRPNDLELTIGQFSGGNQQKWVVGRESSHSPELLIAAHPTRGVDFAATAKIHRRLNELRDQGSTVSLLSSDLEEILGLSDRILVFFKGQIAGVYKKPFDRHEIGRAYGGLTLDKAPK